MSSNDLNQGNGGHFNLKNDPFTPIVFIPTKFGREIVSGKGHVVRKYADFKR